MKPVARSSASFSPSLPHTHADTRTEEARVGKETIPASVGGDGPSTLDEGGAP